jgi:hypothetical protein
MNFIGQKVLVKDKDDYDGNPIPSGDGIVIEENRSNNYALNGLYVMFDNGMVLHVSLTDVVFKNPASVKESDKNDMMNALSMIISSGSAPIMA